MSGAAHAHPLIGAALEATRPASDRIYDALIEELCDLAPDGGWPEDADLLQACGPFEDDELAAACAKHVQAVTDELTLDPALLASWLRHEITVEQILIHLRQATQAAVHDAVRVDVLNEQANRNEAAYERQYERFHGGARPMTLQEQCDEAYALKRSLR